MAIAGIVHPTYNPAGEDLTIPIVVPGQDAFGLHPALTNLASMYSAGEAAFVTNVGTLSEPTTTSSYSTSSLPKQLFSHSDQVTQWMSSIADKPYTSGWGARVAAADAGTPTADLHAHPAAGTNQFMNGGNTQFSVTSSAPSA